MVVRIRFQRMGGRYNPIYKLVVADAKSPRDGKFIEKLGTYHAIPNKYGIKDVQLNVERIKYWISVGAQPTDPARHLLGKAGILPKVPFKSFPVKSVPKSERQMSTFSSASQLGSPVFSSVSKDIGVRFLHSIIKPAIVPLGRR